MYKRPSLNFRKNLFVNHILCASDLIALRPGFGISPMEIDMFIGKKLNRNVNALSMIDSTQFTK